MAEQKPRVVEFEHALLSLDRLAARRLLAEAVDGRPPIQAVEAIIVPALERIGRGWQEGRVALAQVYMSGRICEELVDAVLPAADPARRQHPRIAIATVEDYHQLGKRIVYSVLRASGFELLDFGHGVKVDTIVERAVADEVQILLLSALMLPTALRVKLVTSGLAARGADVRVVVGGAPFNFDDQLWREVGAHAMGRNASEALAIVTRLAGELL